MVQEAWPVLVEVNDYLRRLLAKGEIQDWENLSELPNGLLWQAGRALAKGGEIDPKPLLEQCWQTASDHRLLSAVELVYFDFKGKVDGERLQRNILLMLATGGAAYETANRNWDGIIRYWSWIPGTNLAVPQKPTWVNGISAEVLVEHVYQQARQAKCAGPLEALRLWTKCWRQLDTQRSWDVEVPVAVEASNHGRIFRLCLGKKKDALESTELIEHRDVLLKPFGPSFLQTLHRQMAKRKASTVVWTLQERTSEGGSLPIDGDSAGAAAATAFAAISRDTSCDPNTLLLAAVNEDDSLRIVDGLTEKIKAALGVGITRFGLAEGSVWVPELEQAVEKQWFTIADEAIEFASSLAVSLRKYLMGVVELPDKEGGASWLGERKLTDVYVEPDVLKKEKRGDFIGERQKREQLGPESSEIGKETQPWSEEEDETELRKPWKSELEALGGQLRMAVVVGPPGQGKTELTRMTARQMAQNALEELAGAPGVAPKGISEIDLPLAVQLNQLQGISNESELIVVLADAMVGSKHLTEEVKRYLEQQVHSWQTCLFLDAWDETDKSQDLRPLWRIMEGWKCRVVITTRPYAYRELPVGKDLVQAYRLAPFSDEQRTAFVERWFPEGEKRNRTLNAIYRSHSIRGMTRNAYLLTMICGVSEDGKLEEGITRTELYRLGMEKLLGDERAEDWIPTLQQIAWKMFNRKQSDPHLPQRQLNAILQSKETQVSLGSMSVPELRKELSQRRVLAQRRKSTSKNGHQWEFVFPHRSMVEFLVGGAVERMLTVNKASEKRTWSLLNGKSWDPQWSEVIQFLTGWLSIDEEIEKIRRLFQLLSDETKDDYFCHRLALAMLCTDELSGENRQALKADKDSIHQQGLEVAAAEARGTKDPVSKVLQRWVYWSDLAPRRWAKFYLYLLLLDNEGKTNRLLELLNHPDPDIRSTVIQALHGEIHPEVQLRIVETLADPDSTVRGSAITTLSWRGEAAAQAHILNRLVDLLAHSEWHVRSSAAGALINMGEAVAEPQIAGRLVDLLVHPESDVRSSAASALENVGEAAAQPDIVNRLIYLLTHFDLGVRSSAARVLGSMGKGKSLISGRLVDLLAHPESDVRSSAAEALASVGEAATQPHIVNRLGDLLVHPDLDVRSSAARVLGNLGEAATQRHIVNRLIDLLAHSDDGLRRVARWALGNMGTGVQPHIVEGLVDLLVHPESDVRSSAASALANVGEAATQPHIINRLGDLLVHPDLDVRLSAARALGNLGEVATQRHIVNRLIDLLAHSDDGLRRVARQALRNMGTGVQPQIVGGLVDLLVHPESDVRSSAAEALANVGEAATRPHIINRLGDLLLHPDLDVRSSAARALANVGKAPARPEIVDRLIDLLAHSDLGVRWSATRVLESMGEVPAQPEIVDRLIDLLAHSDLGVRSSAAEVLGNVGEGTSLMVGRLVDLLVHPDPDVRWSAARILGNMRKAMAQPEIVNRLIDLLADSDWGVRSSAAEVLGNVGEGTSLMVGRLVDLLAHCDPSVCSSAARVLGNLKEEATQPHIVNRLIDLLAHSDDGVRRAAADAFGAVGGVAVQPDTLNRLGGLLVHPDPDVRSSAAEALENLGEAAIQPHIDRLIDFLDHSDPDVRRAAAGVFGRMEKAVEKPHLVDRLGDLLDHSDSDVRWSAARALGNIGEPAAKPHIANHLVNLLAHPDSNSNVRHYVVETLGRMGKAVAKPDIFDHLGDLLTHSDPDVRRCARAVLGRMGATGTKPYILARLGDLLDHSDPDDRSSAADALRSMRESFDQPVLNRILDEMDQHLTGEDASSWNNELFQLVPASFRIFRRCDGWEVLSLDDLIDNAR